MQANTYLDYEGVAGEVTASQYKDMITVLSMDFNVHREISSYTGTAMDREASATRLGDITITKLQDNASPDLFREATIGKGKKATFFITKQGDEIEEIMKIELTDAMISNYSLSVQGDRPTECVNISYTELTMTASPSDDQNNVTQPKVYGYSGVKGQKL